VNRGGSPSCGCTPSAATSTIGGIFVHSTLLLPLSLTWESFTIGNGAASRADMKRLIDSHRPRGQRDEESNYTIGCILLSEPFFLPEHLWITAPPDRKPNIVQGKGYDLVREPGLTLYAQVEEALHHLASGGAWPALVGDLPADPRERYGVPVLVRPRLGQGLFRTLVTDAYERRCAVTNEKVLPVLEAGPARPARPATSRFDTVRARCDDRRPTEGKWTRRSSRTSATRSSAASRWSRSTARSG